MAEYDAETATYSACVGANAPSPFTPIETCRLIGLRVVINATAATSLTEAVQFKLTCADWKPNSVEVGGNGNGLRTAPACYQPPTDWSIDQPIKTAKIVIEARNTVGTAVTVNAQLWGCFQN
jgi:hypothetical protein